MKSLAVAAFGLCLTVASVQAQDAPQWSLRAGVHPVQPATYMLDDHWGIEAFAALPVSHDIGLRDQGRAGQIEQLPSTLSIQYHFYDPNGRIRAYAGAGLNYTAFSNERTSGALAGSQLSLDSSIGLGTIELDPYAVGLFIGRHLQ